jgi:cysteine desulfurase/selenocysteine lyase
MTDFASIRRRFPYLDECVYLNTAAAGLTFTGQGAAAAAFYDDVKSKGMNGALAWRAMAGEVAAMLARLLCTSPERIGFVGSTTEAINLLARSLPYRPGESVVVAADEFPSVRLPWDRLPGPAPEVVLVPIPREAERTEALLAAIDERTRILAVSHIHWGTGTRVDLKALAARCRKVGARLLVDGIQAVGAVPVEAELADFYCAAVFKWLISGFGLGFYVLEPSLAVELRPAFVGYFNAASTSLRYGHIDYPGLYALRSALAFLDEVGWDSIYSRVDSLGGQVMRMVDPRSLVTPASRGGIVCFRPKDAPGLLARLEHEGIYVAERGGNIRVSPHFYNSDADVERLGFALARLEGQPIDQP